MDIDAGAKIKTEVYLTEFVFSQRKAAYLFGMPQGCCNMPQIA